MTAASINKPLLARSFNQAAGSYPEHSKLQRGISRRLLSLLCGRGLSPPRDVLELGCGTGSSTRSLADCLPDAAITALDLAANMVFAAQNNLSRRTAVRFVCADMENLPFPSDCFDMVFSSSVIQWSADPQRLMSELCRVLRPQGLACLSSFCQNTLSELRASWARTDSYAHTIDFASPQELSRQLSDCGLKVQLLHSQTEVVPYDGVLDFLRALKKAGIQNCRLDRRCKGLTTPRRFSRMRENYQACYAFGGGILARYDIVFVIAGKS